MGRRNLAVAEYSCCLARDRVTVQLSVPETDGTAVLQARRTLLFHYTPLSRQQRLHPSTALLFPLILLSPAITMAGLFRGPMLAREMRSKQRLMRTHKNTQDLLCSPCLAHGGHLRFFGAQSSFCTKRSPCAEKCKYCQGGVDDRERRSYRSRPSPTALSCDTLLSPKADQSSRVACQATRLSPCCSSPHGSERGPAPSQRISFLYRASNQNSLFPSNLIAHLRCPSSRVVNKLSTYSSERSLKTEAISSRGKRAETTTSLLASAASYATAPSESIAIHPVFLEKLPLLTRPSARRLLPQLSFDNPSMIPESPQMPPLVVFVREQKQLRPDKVLIIQVGDFFEAYGVDAVLLVEYCGLNPMGGKAKAGCPKQNLQQTLDCLTSEGFSVSIFEEVASPVPATPVAATKTRKLRVLTQIVSPSSPLYLPAHVPLFEGEIGAHTPESQPLFSLYYSPSSGYCCGVINVPLRTLRVEGGLTADGVEMYITAYSGGIPRGELFVHQHSASFSALNRATQFAHQFFPSLKKTFFKDYSTPSAFHQAVLQHVAASLQLPSSHFTLQSHLDYFSPCVASPESPSMGFAIQSGGVSAPASSDSSLTLSSVSPLSPGEITIWKSEETAEFPTSLGLPGNGPSPAVLRSTESEEKSNVVNRLPTTSPFMATARPKFLRPHPLNISTASQLGLLRSLPRQANLMASTAASLVPPLHLAALPPGAPVTAARFLQRLLLFPPPHHVADSIQSILSQLVLLDCRDSRVSTAFMKGFQQLNSCCSKGQPDASFARESAQTQQEQALSPQRRANGRPERENSAVEATSETEAAIFGKRDEGGLKAEPDGCSHKECATGHDLPDESPLLVPVTRVLDSGRVVQLVSSCSGNRRFFLDLLSLLAPTRYCLTRYPASLLRPLLNVLQHEAQQTVSQGRLLAGVEAAIKCIEKVVLLEEEDQQEAAEAAAAAAIAAAEHIGRLCAAGQDTVPGPEIASVFMPDSLAASAQADGVKFSQLRTRAVWRTQVEVAQEKSKTPKPCKEPRPGVSSPISCSPGSAEMLVPGGAIFPINTQDHRESSAARAAALAAFASAEASRTAARAVSQAAGGLAASSGTEGLLPILDDFFQRMERFRGHVQPACVPHAHAVVAAAVDDLLVAIFEDFLGLPSLPSLPRLFVVTGAVPGLASSVGASSSCFECCASSAMPDASTKAQVGLTSREVIDLYIVRHNRQHGVETSSNRRWPFPSPDESARFSPDTDTEISDDALLQSISLLQKQRVLQLASLSGADAQGEADLQRRIGALQKRLWGDLLNESVYLKKVKPPVEVPKTGTGQRSKESRESSDLKRKQRGTRESSVRQQRNTPQGGEELHVLTSTEALCKAGDSPIWQHDLGMSEAERGLRDGVETMSSLRRRDGGRDADAGSSVQTSPLRWPGKHAQGWARAPLVKPDKAKDRASHECVHSQQIPEHPRSLSQHASFAASEGWNLPRLLDQNEKPQLTVQTLTPYYMSRPDPATLREQLERVAHSKGETLTSNVADWGSTRTLEPALPTALCRERERGGGQPDLRELPTAKQPSHKREPVSYTFDMRGLFVLTGENMAGKSTFCRSLLALVILANAGLFCPCGPSTVVPRYRAFLASSYLSHDSPLESKSFFYEELSQLHHILSQARSYSESRKSTLSSSLGLKPRSDVSSSVSASSSPSSPSSPSPVPCFPAPCSEPPGTRTTTPSLDRAPCDAGVSIVSQPPPFVMIDEPCKGTAPEWGSAFVGAALELLGGSNTHGVLSTHLHRELIRMPLQLHSSVRFKRMGVRQIARFQHNANRSRDSAWPPLPRSATSPFSDCHSRADGAQSAYLRKESGAVAALTDALDNLHFEEHIHTFELLDGVCTDSNAMQTAWKVGMPQAIIARALQLQKHLHSPPVQNVSARAATVMALHNSDSANTAATGESPPPLQATFQLGTARLLRGQPVRHQENEEAISDKMAGSSDVPPPLVLEENGLAGGGNAASSSPGPDTQHNTHRSVDQTLKHAHSSTASVEFMARLKNALAETVHMVTHDTAKIKRLVQGNVVSQKDGESSFTPQTSGPPTSRPQIVQLPPLSSQLMPPPTWQDGAACVYLLVAPGKPRRSAGHKAYMAIASEELQRPSSVPDGNLLQPAAFHANVYVGETERLLLRLQSHRRSPLWAHAQVIAVRVADKGEALRTETTLINRLKGEAGVVLFSLKDGNRKTGVRRFGESLTEHLRHAWRQGAVEEKSSYL
ncbi:muts domain protein [Cystoisospora suis]|uniref:Muts domain protein n=1 Tax=Cystoisospora suis TaxID=483139 RepID=A0A2C6L145_9APIC|nr:muts domain protein [Cystoisospora suis]